MNKEELFEKLTPIIRVVIDGGESIVLKFQTVCKFLNKNVEYYDWVGFYFLEEGMLHLGPYVGSETEHGKIELGKGLCGQAANLKATFISDDVNKEDNYLSCNIHVKSEIVVPILNNGKVFGVLDIDSHTISAFSDEDKVFLEWVTKAIASIL